MGKTRQPIGIRPWSFRKGEAGLSGPVSLLLIVAPACFLFLFFFYPLGSVMIGGLRDHEGRLSFVRVARLLGDAYYLRIIGFTVKQAVLSTLLSVAIGLPGAYLLARYEFVGKRLIRALTTVPFVLPSIIVVLGFVRVFGNNGLVNRFLMATFHLDDPPLRILYSLRGILLAHAFYNFPICVRIVSSLWARIHPGTEEAARSLGAHGIRLFWNTTLRQILPGILSAAALIFIFCLLSFAVVLVLGGGPRHATIEVEVYRLTKVSLDLATGSALAIIGACLSLISLYIYVRLQHWSGFSERMGSNSDKPRLSSVLHSPLGVFFVSYLFLMAVVILAPMASVLAYSFQERTGWRLQHVSVEWYRRILSATGPYLRAVLNSLLFGGMTVALSVPVGTLLAYVLCRSRTVWKHVAEAVVMLPIGVSTIMLGLGYLIAYQRLPWRMVGSWYAIVFAHSVIAYPFVIRVLTATLRKISLALREAASSLGAGPWQIFRYLELPLSKSALVTGAAFSFGISVGEINATLMLYDPDLVTIPVVIYRLISSYNFIGACAMGSVLIVFCLIAFLIIDHAGGDI